MSSKYYSLIPLNVMWVREGIRVRVCRGGRRLSRTGRDLYLATNKDKSVRGIFVTVHSKIYTDQNNFQASILRCHTQGRNIDSTAYSIGEGTFKLLPFFVSSLHRTGAAVSGHSSRGVPNESDRVGPMPQTCTSRPLRS